MERFPNLAIALKVINGDKELLRNRIDLNAAIDELKEELIWQALGETNGVGYKAAKLLKLSKGTFSYRKYRVLRKLKFNQDGTAK